MLRSKKKKKKKEKKKEKIRKNIDEMSCKTSTAHQTTIV